MCHYYRNYVNDDEGWDCNGNHGDYLYSGGMYCSYRSNGDSSCDSSCCNGSNM